MKVHYSNPFYRPQRSLGKVIFSQASVILSTGTVPGPGGSAPGGACSQGGVPALGESWSGEPARRRECLVQGGACSWGVPGPERVCLVETPPGWLLLRAVHILLEYIVVMDKIVTSDGSRDATSRSKFFHFKQFWEEILQNNRLAHSPYELGLPLGNPGSATGNDRFNSPH